MSTRFCPQHKYKHHCKQGPTDLQGWLHNLVTVSVRVFYDRRWGGNYKPRVGLRLDWINRD